MGGNCLVNSADFKKTFDELRLSISLHKCVNIEAYHRLVGMGDVNLCIEMNWL